MIRLFIFKLLHTVKITLFCIVIFISIHQYTDAQTTTRAKIIDHYQTYNTTVKSEPAKRMVEIKEYIPDIIYDLRYATENNFTHRKMYTCNKLITFLRATVVEALAKVQKDLNSKGLGLKIFDAYRPFSVSKKFWDLVKDERYVANPVNGSNHNRGTAVDLTIVNLQTGKELDMGTGFDNFTDTAHLDFDHLPKQVMSNRLLLKDVMEKYGFCPLATEWWHYTFKSEIKFEVLDIPFQKLNIHAY